MKTACIYSLIDPRTNIDRYIGCTIIKPTLRYNQHLREKKRTRKCTWIKSLKNKNLKPIFNIIDIVPKEEVYFWEMHYISLYKSWNFELLNATNGGVGVKTTKISLFAKLNKYNANVKKRKKVLQYDKDGIFIMEWNSLEDISNHYSLNKISLMSAIYGHARMHNGFAWRYKTEKYPLKINIREKITPPKKPILQYDLQGNFIREWDGTSDVIKNIKGTGWAIKESLSKRQHSAYGYIWRYKLGEIDKKINHTPTIKPRKSRIVLQLDLNNNLIKEWFGAIEVQNELNISAHDIRAVCRPHTRNSICKGYKWKYKNNLN